MYRFFVPISIFVFVAAYGLPQNSADFQLTGQKIVKNSQEKKPEETQKSAAKPEDLEKARTHGLQGIVDSIRSKIQQPGPFPGFPIPYSQPAPSYGYYSAPATIAHAPILPAAAPALPALPSLPVASPVSYLPHPVPSPIISKPVLGYGQKPVYTISQQVIHKPVYTEVQSVIHKPVYTELQEVVHKPVITELQQVIKKPLFTEHVVKKPVYNAVHQEIVDRPLHLQSEAYHIVEKPVAQVVNLPQQVIQPVVSHAIHQPSYSLPPVSPIQPSYYPAQVSTVPVGTLSPSAVISAGFPHYAGPINSPLAYINTLPVSSGYSGGYGGYSSGGYIGSLGGGYGYSGGYLGSGGYSGLPSVVSSLSPVASVATPVLSAASPVVSSYVAGVEYPTGYGSAYGGSYGGYGSAYGGSYGGYGGYYGGYGSGYGSYGHLNDYELYLTPSYCKAGEGCGRAMEDGYFQEVQVQPEYQPAVYGTPAMVTQPETSYMPMPYATKYPVQSNMPMLGKQGEQKSSGGKATGKSADEDQSGDATRYLVPADNQQFSEMQMPDKQFDPNSEDYLKNAINEEEKRRNALRDDLSNLEIIARRVQQTPDIMSRLQNIIDEVMDKQRSANGQENQSNGNKE